MGLQIQSDGSMTVDASKLGNALGKLTEMSSCSPGRASSTLPRTGFAKRFPRRRRPMLGVNGSLSTLTDGLGQQLQRKPEGPDRLNLRLAGVEKRLRAQYNRPRHADGLAQHPEQLYLAAIAAWNSGR